MPGAVLTLRRDVLTGAVGASRCPLVPRKATMTFTLRLDGTTVATFDTEEEAVARARAILRDDADKQPEVLDAETGQPVAPGASKGSRDDLARKMGF
jgi:hypothetical protein